MMRHENKQYPLMHLTTAERAAAAATATTLTAKLSIRMPNSSINIRHGILWHHQMHIIWDAQMLAVTIPNDS